jgi:hypothetical protein
MGLVSRLARTGLRRGLLEGSRGWMMVGVSLTTAQLLHRLLSEREVRASVELQPGDHIDVRVIEPPPR